MGASQNFNIYCQEYQNPTHVTLISFILFVFGSTFWGPPNLGGLPKFQHMLSKVPKFNPCYTDNFQCFCFWFNILGASQIFNIWRQEYQTSSHVALIIFFFFNILGPPNLRGFSTFQHMASRVMIMITIKMIKKLRNIIQVQGCS